MKLKKIPYYLLLIPLSAGAISIIGFLSFTGMFTLVPVLSLAITSLILSVAYEGEIYIQNIKGALNKLFFKSNYLKQHLADEYLLAHFPKTKEEFSPDFFKDYKKQLKWLNELNHQLNHQQDENTREITQQLKQQAEKKLRDMEKWFALQLFSADVGKTDYEQELRDWLSKNGQQAIKEDLKQRQKDFNWVKIGSLLAGLFMSLGTMYLLTESFSAIPVLATLSLTALPAIIAPLAMIAGIAYGFLIFNAVTDMINNGTLQKIGNLIVNIDLRKPSSVLSSLPILSVFILAVGLTLCTAGTWWTIVKNTRPLFTWMSKIPNLIASGIFLITGGAQLAFNLENINTSLEIIDQAMKKSLGGKLKAKLAQENWLQLINLPRLALVVTYEPLRLMLAMTHAIGEFIKSTPSFLQYLFYGHQPIDNIATHLQEQPNQTSNHAPDTNILTAGLKTAFSPLFLLAAGWDYCATRLVRNPRQTCGLLQMDTDPRLSKWADLAKKYSENVVILHNDQLFYVDLINEEVTQIIPDTTNQQNFDTLKTKFSNDPKIAGNEELDHIFTLTTTHHGRDTRLSWNDARARQTSQESKKPTISAPPSPFTLGFRALLINENWLQLINLPRLIIVCTFVPLRIILFIGHLISIAVSSDRVPGIPEIASAILGFISEFFEDLHYFLGDLFHDHAHSHDTQTMLQARLGQAHGHDHTADLPTRVLKMVFSPLFYLAAAWDYWATRLVQKPCQPCGLLHMTTDPSKAEFTELPILQDRSAVISYNDQLFYANVIKNKVTPITATAANQNDFDTLKAQAQLSEKYGMANEKALNCIFSLTNRHGNDTKLSWEDAEARQRGQHSKKSSHNKTTAKESSPHWQVTHISFLIERYIAKYQANQPNSEDINKLRELQQDVLAMKAPSKEAIQQCIQQKAPQFSQQQRGAFFAYQCVKAHPQTFVNSLSQRVC